MEFGRYKSFYWYHTEAGPTPLFAWISSKLKAGEFYARLRREFSVTQRKTGEPPPPFLSTLLTADEAWYQSGEPEYRVYPDAAMAFGHTDIDIDCKHLRLPWPAFTITFPRWLVCAGGGDEIDSLLITEVMEPSIKQENVLGRRADGGIWVRADAPNDQRKLVMMISRGGTEDMTYWKLPLDAGTSLKTVFESYVCRARYGIDREQSLWLFAIAVCTCFFTVGRSSQSRLVEPCFERGRNTLRRIWEVGRELTLPVYDDAGPRHVSRDSDGTGRSPRSHFRRGHMRWQPYGPRENPHYELIFIPPTVVMGEGLPSRVEPVSIKLHA